MCGLFSARQKWQTPFSRWHSSFSGGKVTATMATTTPTTTSTALSDYEKKRAENIERNNSRLRALGLISAQEEDRSNATAWGRKRGHRDTEPVLLTQETVNKKRKKHFTTTTTSVPSRKSRRLQGANPELQALDDELDENGFAVPVLSAAASPRSVLFEFETDQEREARVNECREARQRAALEVARAGATAAGKENPTATYDHCLMRVKTMTENKLANRVKAIERATGKHCVVKMAIFKSCLQDEGMWDLAKLASESLERLKALLPPPDE
jgi:hypothetical protein